MKKIILSLTMALMFMSVIAVGVAAAAEPAVPSTAGPFNGKFQGKVYGDQGSQAPSDPVSIDCAPAYCATKPGWRTCHGGSSRRLS